MTPRTLAYVGAAIAGVLLGVAAILIAVYRLFGLSGELIGAAVTLAGTVLTVLGVIVKAYADSIVGMLRAKVEETSAKVDENTEKTEAAKAAAQEAAEQLNWRQQATSLSLENDDLRRKIALLEGLPECLDCRQKIGVLLRGAPVLRRRTDPPHEVPR